MHYPVNIILPNENASMTMKEAATNLTDILIYSKKLFENLEERINRLKDQIQYIHRCQKLVLEKIQNQQFKKIIKHCSYPDYFLKNEVKSLCELYEQSQKFKSTLCPVLSENINTLNNYLDYLSDFQVRKLPINKEEKISHDRSLIDFHVESYIRSLLDVDETSFDENIQSIILQTAGSERNNDINISQIPYSLIPEKFRILVNEKSYYGRKGTNTVVVRSESNKIGAIQENDKKVLDIKLKNQDKAIEQCVPIPPPIPASASLPVPPPIPEEPVFINSDKNEVNKVAFEPVEVPGRGDLLAEIRNAKGGTGTFKLKSVRLAEIKPAPAPIKAINIFDEINNRLSQRRKHIKDTDESKNKDTPMTKFLEEISTDKILVEKEYTDEF